MKMKKTLTAVVALALVAAVSVAGTMAYLTDKTGPVTNTFTAGSLGADMKLALLETPAQQGTDGQYTLTDGTPVANGQEYANVLPGSTNAMDPHVNVTGLTTDAYLFIEVVNDESDAIEASVNTDNWTLMEGVTSKTTDAKVYKYHADGKVANGQTLDKIYVLKDNTFKVGTTMTNSDEMKPIVVKAYICQAAGFGSAEDAWKGAF